MQIHLICKVCYTEMEAQFTADEINDEINLFVVPCKQCAAQHRVQADGDTVPSNHGISSDDDFRLGN